MAQLRMMHQQGAPTHPGYAPAAMPPMQQFYAPLNNTNAPGSAASHSAPYVHQQSTATRQMTGRARGNSPSSQQQENGQQQQGSNQVGSNDSQNDPLFMLK